VLDLSKPGLLAWLRNNGAYDFAELPGAVQRAEAHPSVEAALVTFGIALDEASSRDPASFKRRLQNAPAKTAFLTILGQLGQARLIRLLEWLSEPGKSQRHVLLAALFSPDAPEPAHAVRASIRRLSRQLLMQRLISHDRLETLQTCCARYKERP